ncbi:hypothetical protein HCJ02_01815 [Listeria seeligeri]|uniref:hypothetical protein n=1 Tax=Listeria TaxID=1637 RepID=UPI001624F0F8|nr:MULTISPECIES: hypothetical protein [Listeria]MBC1532070.1 hypothetical protein [Listeria seeligeri]MBC1827117.1 hypothetical protein [Listeria seeligeri]MBC1840091.1 hypothetical protein [Listeria seeligeri]MBC6141905.1 hypothetical protein [Listeria seeligeri]MBC6302472.1 hypothetical protein [Listeria immobilis]
MKSINLKQFAYWIAAYMPVISLLILKYLRSTYYKDGFWMNIKFLKINIFGDFFIYLSVCFITILFYWLSAKIFERCKMKEIRDANGEKRIFVREYKPVSINEYSFFILSLLLPFVIEEPSDLLNLLIMLTLIIIIIIIMIKKKQIIINPIFLFSKFKVFSIIGQDGGIRKEYFVITKSSGFTDSPEKGYEFVKFDSTFSDVLFIAENTEKNSK